MKENSYFPTELIITESCKNEGFKQSILIHTNLDPRSDCDLDLQQSTSNISQFPYDSVYGDKLWIDFRLQLDPDLLLSEIELILEFEPEKVILSFFFFVL